jgi:3',5'-cyclic AMP phosphodiesterase CpdA
MPTALLRFAHFSDVHLTARPLGWRLRDLFSKRLTGWANLHVRRAKHFRDAGRVVAAMVAEIRARRPDHLIFSGDATTLGFESEYAAAAKALGVAGPDALPGIAVPGNHDYYTRGPARAGFFERYFAPWQRGERVSEDVYPFAQRVGPVWLVGVNSSVANRLLWDSRGLVGPEQRERLRRLLRQLAPGPRILVTHYPLYLADGLPETRWRLLRDWEAFRNVAAEGGVALWLHGHRHTAYVLPSEAGRQFPIICAGSATQEGRAGYNEYAFRDKILTMTRRRWDAASGGFVDSETMELALAR